MVGWLIGWCEIGWLVDWMVRGWLVDWMVRGWLVDPKIEKYCSVARPQSNLPQDHFIQR